PQPFTISDAFPNSTTSGATYFFFIFITSVFGYLLIQLLITFAGFIFSSPSFIFLIALHL
ncbi:hypothetical protein, partial [Bacillus mobilis]|uniref:hypothetical protein n=1 Tax=Bacillus mobilis TaxID=2026190 RepID=UPI0035590052